MMDEQEKLRKALVNAHKAGDTATAKEIAKRLRNLQSGSALSEEQIAQAYEQPGVSIDPSAEPWQEGEYITQEMQRRIKDATGLEIPQAAIAGMTALGAGIRDIYEGGKRLLGMGEGITEEEELRMAAIERDFPISSTVGRVTGQTLPFLAAGPAAASAGRAAQGVRGLGTASKALAPASTTAGRVGQTAALGAAEGATIEASRAESDAADIAAGAGLGGSIAGTLEAVLPGIGRVFTRLGKRAAYLNDDGTLTNQARKIIEDEGLDPVKARQAMEQVEIPRRAELNQTEMGRKLRFEEFDLPYTRGDIIGGGSKEGFEQRSLEARLLESTQDDLGQEVRNIRRSQSAGLQSVLDDQVKQLGVSDQQVVGESVKDALINRRGQLKRNQRALYDRLAEEADNVEQVPLDIYGGIDWETIEDIEAVNESAIQGIKKRLKRYGIADEAEIAEYVEKGGKVEPLTLKNAERFRKFLNSVSKSDPQIQAAVASIKDSLDTQSEMAIDALEQAGRKTEIGEIARAARGATTELKSEFNPKRAVGRLTDFKRGSDVPVIEASRVVRDLFPAGQTTKVEKLDEVVTSLKKSGAKGRQALGNLQSAAVQRFMDKAFASTSNRVGDQILFNGRQLSKAIDEFGEQNLQTLFADKPDVLMRLKRLQRIGDDLAVDTKNIPKGSASVILDALNKTGIMTLSSKVPGLGVALEGLQSLAEKKALREQAKTVGRAAPKMTEQELKTIGILRKTMPQTAVALGLDQMRQEEENQQQ